MKVYDPIVLDETPEGWLAHMPWPIETVIQRGLLYNGVGIRSRGKGLIEINATNGRAIYRIVDVEHGRLRCHLEYTE